MEKSERQLENGHAGPDRGRESFLGQVRLIVTQRVEKIASAVGLDSQLGQLLPGKMLRTQLAGRLAEGLDLAGDLNGLHQLCAATELVHTASLCHDDVIDNALIRRAQPTLWRTACTSSAILIGDLLLCEAMDLLDSTHNGRHTGHFVAKVRQVVAAEARQELIYRGKQMDEETCVWLARNKTGPLFAFAAGVCGSDDKSLFDALERAGYDIGTAYQLADDLLDSVGEEDVVGKTLGTDCQRQLLTLAQGSEEGARITEELIGRLCSSALEELAAYPGAQQATRDFLACDLQPVLENHLTIRMELAI